MNSITLLTNTNMMYLKLNRSDLEVCLFILIEVNNK